MDGLRSTLLLAAFAIAAVFNTACQSSDDAEGEATKREALRKNCLARVAQKDIAGATDELDALMRTGALEPEECDSHGAQLESIAIVEGLLADDMPDELDAEVSR